MERVIRSHIIHNYHGRCLVKVFNGQIPILWVPSFVNIEKGTCVPKLESEFIIPVNLSLSCELNANRMKNMMGSKLLTELLNQSSFSRVIRS